MSRLFTFINLKNTQFLSGRGQESSEAFEHFEVTRNLFLHPPLSQQKKVINLKEHYYER